MGLVGPSGGGKSTLTRLLLRFDDITNGAILIDGQDIRRITQTSLRDAVGYVPQEPLLFHRSIRENIAYGRPDATQAQIENAARAICQAAGYVGAGTVEFLLSRSGQVSFLEVNTRLQVEHCVTEETSGVDLVLEQLRIADGLPLSITSTPQARGHSFEFRINAEDPYNFIPSPGQITSCHLPGGNGIRVDSHIYQGYTVPPYYDSLIGKICTHGKTREEAMAKMRVALAEVAINGIKTNTALHRDLFVDPGFAQGGVSIHYLEQWLHKRQDSQQ